METFEFKKSLFGYKKSSVYQYMSEQSRDFQDKLELLMIENKSLTKKITSVKEELNIKSKEYDELNSLNADNEKSVSELTVERDNLVEKTNELTSSNESLLKEIEELKAVVDKNSAEITKLREENEKFRSNQADIANVIFEAQNFSDSLKRQAEIEYNHQKSENENKIQLERERIKTYVKSINDLGEAVRRACDAFSNNIMSKKDELKYISEKMRDKNNGEESSSNIKFVAK